MIFIHSFAYTRWRKRPRTTTVIPAIKSAHFDGIDKSDSAIQKIP